MEPGGWYAFLQSEGSRWYLPPLLMLMAAVYLTVQALKGGFWQRRGVTQLLLLLLMQLLLFRSALGRSDPNHLTYATVLLWPMCLMPIERGLLRWWVAARKEPGTVPRKHGWIMLPALAMLWYVHHHYQPLGGLQQRLTRATELLEPRDRPEEPARIGRIHVDAHQLQRIRKVCSYVRNNTGPEESLYDFSSQGGYCLLSSRRSVTRYHQTVYAATPGMQREIVDALEAECTKLVILSTDGFHDRIDDVPATRRHPIIAHYLASKYEPGTTIDGTVILTRVAEGNAVMGSRNRRRSGRGDRAALGTGGAGRKADRRVETRGR